MKPATRLAASQASRKGRLDPFVERHTRRSADPTHVVWRTATLLGKLGFSERSALALAADPEATASVWFGVGAIGAIAGTLLGTVALAYVTRPKAPTPTNARGSTPR